MWLHCHRHGGGIFPVAVSPVSFLPSSPFGWYYLYQNGRPEKLGTEWHIVVGVEIGHLHICIFLLFPKQKGSLFIAYLTRGLGPFIQSVVQLSKNVQSRGAGQAADTLFWVASICKNSGRSSYYPVLLERLAPTL